MCEGEDGADWIVRLNNTGGPVDVWEVDLPAEPPLVESPEGYYYLPAALPAGRMRLVMKDQPPRTRR